MRDKFRRFMTTQFGNPSGFLGTLIGRRMAKGNRFDAEWSVSLLNIQPDDRVLEIGFGPGVSTQLASAKASKGFVAGIDHSRTMVQAAAQRNAAAVQSGRLELRVGEAGSLPYPDQSFDIVFSLHSIYFWPEPIDSLREIKRVLKQEGLLGITILPKDQWTANVDTSIMTLYFSSEVVALFSAAVYRNVHVEVSPPKEAGATLECILGVK